MPSPYDLQDTDSELTAQMIPPSEADSGTLAAAQNGDINSGMRPETADFLNNLAGIGTGAFLSMRQADTPEYEDWRDGNFVADGSGNYVSREGQAYTDDELEQMHGVLSRQAGNPLVSGLFAGPKSPLADYMTWRNQNYLNKNETGGAWEDEDGNLYTEPALQEMFGAKFAAQPAGGDESDKAEADRTASDNEDKPGVPEQAQRASQPGTALPQTADSLRQTAGYEKWRDQNFRKRDDGKWEAPDGRVYTGQELQDTYASNLAQAKQGTPTQADIIAYIRQQADSYGLPQALALGLVNKESSFNPKQKGGLEEAGLFQILPTRDREAHKDANGNNFKLDIGKARADWQYNVKAGLALLKEDYGFAQKNSPDDPIAATYARYNAHNNWKGYRSLNSNVHDHVYGKWIVRNGHPIYVEGYMDFYNKWSGK
jgi:soluble lytic murein transglycosylase-like protein